MDSLKSLMSPFWSILTLLFNIFFLYALIGMLCFGGRITRDTEEIRNNDATPDIWGLMNFNDFPSALVTLFSLMVVNNWMITVEMYANLTDQRGLVLLFFVSFYTLAVLVGLNIIVCFSIDMYASIRRLEKQQTKHEENLY
jgi:high-affinity nickel permease